MEKYENRQAIADAAAILDGADTLVIAAGAGLGVDSGLPDFRGAEGFWRAYPAYRALGLNFQDLANPSWFESEPELAWGFYGHRLGLYRTTVPHEGFGVLLRLAQAKPGGFFVVTSNVDGQFQKAGFPADRVLEVHGTIHQNQCLGRCGAGMFPAVAVQVDSETMRARPPLPSCPACGGLARPNVLMFEDSDWDGSASAVGQARFQRWLATAAGRAMAVAELGAGHGVPTVRRISEALVSTFGARLVRINPVDVEVPPGQVGIQLGASRALALISGVSK